MMARRLPCSIETAALTSDGVRLVFAKSAEWRFNGPRTSDPKSRYDGLVAGGDVTFFLDTGETRTEKYFSLAYGQEMRFWIPHITCQVRAAVVEGRAILRVSDSFFQPPLRRGPDVTEHDLGRVR